MRLTNSITGINGVNNCSAANGYRFLGYLPPIIPRRRQKLWCDDLFTH
jgi:hypothetical protein